MNAAQPSGTPKLPLFVMIGAGVGFLAWFALVIWKGVPSSNIATFGSKNDMSKIGILPFLICGVIFLGAAFWYMQSARNASQFLPLLLVPLLSLFFSILALYFSLFQVTIRTDCPA
jgi:hypothetical protein